MHSNDILHSFFVPAMRVKEDVVPGQYSYLWFEPNKLGTFRIFCAEYCGDGHSAMLGTLRVVTEQEYEDYVVERQGSDQPKVSPEEKGQKLFTSAGCVACHSIDGSTKIGPSLKGVFGHPVEIEGGQTVPADENYIRESINNPGAKLVKQFTTVPMPSFKGQLSDEQIDALIAYIKSLSK